MKMTFELPEIVMRVYDTDEYWDLSGVPFTLAQLGIRDLIDKPLTSDTDPNCNDIALD